MKALKGAAAGTLFEKIHIPSRELIAVVHRNEMIGGAITLVSAHSNGAAIKEALDNSEVTIITSGSPASDSVM